MSKIRTLIVGSAHRPPAKYILGRLPPGAKLWLKPEPDNPYDPLAIQVLVAPGEIPEGQHEGLERDLESTSFELAEVLAQDFVFLGYVAASGGKPLAKEQNAGEGDLVGNKEIHEVEDITRFQNEEGQLVGRLEFLMTGQPGIVLTDEGGEIGEDGA